VHCHNERELSFLPNLAVVVVASFFRLLVQELLVYNFVNYF
jgi:hypothetical protein